MNKYFKIFALAVCAILTTVTFSFAYTNTISFQKNAAHTDAPSYTIGSDTLFVDLWMEYDWNGSYGEWNCRCCAPNLNVTVTSNTVSGGMAADSQALTLSDYAYTGTGTNTTAALTASGGRWAITDVNQFRNADPGISLTLCTNGNKTPSSSSALELEDGQNLTVSKSCSTRAVSGVDVATTQTATDTATVSVAATNSALVLSSSSAYASASSFAPDTDDIYIQVTDADENTKGYSAQNVTVTLSSSTLGDSETITLTETDTNTGIFQSGAIDLVSANSATADGKLQISTSGDTINVSYTDNDTSSDTASASGTTAALLSSFTVSASSTQVAGTPFDLTITAKNSSGDTVTSYTGTVNLTKTYVSPTSGTKTISPTTATFSSSDSGVKTISMTYSDCGTITITATDSSNTSFTGTSSNITFYPYDFSFTASGLDTAATGSAYARHTVNKPFTLAVTARDASGSTTPNYRGTANLTINYSSPSSSQSGSLATSSLTSGYWSSGIATISSQTYDKWGTITLTATDSTRSASTGTSSSIIFLPKDFTISLSSPKPSRTYFYPNENFSCTVTARDYNNATLTNYQGTITFTASGLTLPSDYTFTTTDSGAYTFTDSLYGTSSASTSISAKDSTYTSVTSESKSVTIKTGTVKVISKTSAVGKAAVTVKLVDSSNSVLTEDDSTTFKIKLSEAKSDSSASSATTATAATFTDGVATIYVTDNEAEKVTITPTSISQDLSSKAGTVTFGTLKGQNIGIPLWREIKEPGMWRELKEPRKKKE